MSNYTSVFAPDNLCIGIAGIIGSGKSTLTKSLAERLDFDACLEPVGGNPYLDLFYKDMHAHAFPMQVELLNQRFKLHQQMVWSDNGTIQDRTIYEDMIFAYMLWKSGHITDLNFKTYKGLRANMTNFLHRPDVIVYLDVEPEIAAQRVKQRSRTCEDEIPVEYLRSLKEGYEDWLVHIDKQYPVIRLDWNEFQTTEEVVAAINKCLESQRRPTI